MKTVLLLIVLNLASSHFVGAQQEAKIRRIGYVTGTGAASNQDLTLRHCGIGHEISVMSKVKSSSLSIGALREAGCIPIYVLTKHSRAALVT
jgi:hypothetical protein